MGKSVSGHNFRAAMDFIFSHLSNFWRTSFLLIVLVNSLSYCQNSSAEVFLLLCIISMRAVKLPVTFLVSIGANVVTFLEVKFSFPVIHKVGNVGIFNSKHHSKSNFAFKFIALLTTSNFVSFEVVQKCQHSQLCVLFKNSNVDQIVEDPQARFHRSRHRVHGVVS